MAKQFDLIPHDAFERMTKGEVKAQVDAGGDMPSVRVYGVEPGADNVLTLLAELLPKQLRPKAKLLLHYLSGKINLDTEGRVVYTDGRAGSHLFDLVRYLVSPVSRFGSTRLIDLPAFADLLLNLGTVPQSALRSGKRLKDLATMTGLPKPKKKRKTIAMRKSRR
jgi:hypothetical protein